MRTAFLLVLILGLLTGCSAPRALYALKVHPRSVDWPIEALTENLPESYVHEVQLVIGEKNFSWLGAAEVDDEFFTLVGLTPLGGRLFLLRYDGEFIQFLPSPMFKNPIKPERILRDFFLIYAHPEFLQAQGVLRHQVKDVTTLKTPNRERITIRTSGNLPVWNQYIHYENHSIGYELVITPRS